MSYIILFAVLYSVLFLCIAFLALRVPTEGSELAHTTALRDYIPYGAALFAIFVLQLILARFLPGHKQDSGLFQAWTSFGLKHKMSEYYTTDLYVDYPPVYLCLLYGIGKIAALFGISPQSGAYTVFIKLIPILCDSVFSIFIFSFAKERTGIKKAGAIALLSAVNPAMILNSTIWGQVDSFTLLLTLAFLFTLYNKKYVLSFALLALCFLTKPQMVIFSPLLGFTVLADFIECIYDKTARRKMIVQILCSMVAAVAVLLIVPLPITGFRYGLMYERYAQAMNLYPYVTLNAANLYGAFNLNWADVNSTFLFLSYKVWGFVFIVLMSLTVGVVSFKIKDRKRIFYLGAFTVATIYMFAHTMHERYLYALIPLLLLLYVMSGDRRLLFLYGAFSVTHFCNVAQVLVLNLQDDFILSGNVMFILLSWIQLILYIVMLWVWVQMLWKKQSTDSFAVGAEKKKTIKEEVHKRVRTTQVRTVDLKEFSVQGEEQAVRVTRVDVWIMLGLSLLYSCFAFWNLGSHCVPETGWYPQKAEESAVVDLGSVCPVQQIYVYSGWIDRRNSDSDVLRDITLEVSQNGTDWETLEEQINLNTVWHWNVTEVDVQARYFRLTVDDGRFYLNEIAFYGDSESERYIPVAAYGDDNDAASLMIDEQDRVVYAFSWYDGTYFDEIYHPRTAYEQLTHRYPYENTHPPLGKVIISLGIAIFGMNPFGWRFFGTLCGVLMVPMSYMLGKRLFKNSFYAFCCAFLFSFDFMHLSQTRLATIDSYTAFFVMGMYYFMYRYLCKNFYLCGVKKTLPSLLLSGIFFGLGAATKWQGIYAGVGLAVLFFASLMRRYLEYRTACHTTRKDEKTRHVIESFRPMATQTILFAALFFVVIPAAIYFLSYIPAMMTPVTGIRFFFENQPSMYHYHSGLTSDHPYGSAWWSWVLDMKPLYAYSPNRSFIPRGTSMGISSFGNPFIWWLTIPVIVGGIVQMVRKKGDWELAVILVGFASMYLPWVLVPRIAFIYHFFPCVIFVVLGIVYFMKKFAEQNPKEKKYIYIYLAAVFILFCMFYPVLTGIAVPTAYVDTLLKWLPTWVLG